MPNEEKYLRNGANAKSELNQKWTRGTRPLDEQTRRLGGGSSPHKRDAARHQHTPSQTAVAQEWGSGTSHWGGGLRGDWGETNCTVAARGRGAMALLSAHLGVPVPCSAAGVAGIRYGDVREA
jgi:hypothetical protein